MVDWLEELLALAQEEDGEGQEDALGLEVEAAAVPAPKSGEEEMPEGRREGGALARDGEERAPAGAGAWERRPGRGALAAEEWDGAPGPGGGAGSGPVQGGAGGGEPIWHGLEAAAEGRDGAAAPGGTGAGHGGAGRQGAAAEPDAAADSMAAERGLEGLYRQAAQAGRPAAQGLAAERAGRTALAGGAERSGALTVDELDWAIRRDSRRYDGGMALF